MTTESSTESRTCIDSSYPSVTSFDNNTLLNTQLHADSTMLALLLGISITMFATAINLSISASLPAQILFKVSIIATFLASISSAFAFSVPYLESRHLHCWTEAHLRISQSLSVAAAVILGLVAGVSMVVAKLLG